MLLFLSCLSRVSWFNWTLQVQERIRPKEVRAIRLKWKVSHAVFARLLNVPVATEAGWEVGRRNPSDAALRLLQIAQTKPEVLLTTAEA